jgi:hypothetical protein
MLENSKSLEQVGDGHGVGVSHQEGGNATHCEVVKERRTWSSNEVSKTPPSLIFDQKISKKNPP